MVPLPCTNVVCGRSFGIGEDNDSDLQGQRRLVSSGTLAHGFQFYAYEDEKQIE